MRELVEFVTRNLVDQPEAVEVREIATGDQAVRLEIKVAPEDVGKVIGRQGRIVRAIRLLARAAAKSYRRVDVEVV